MNMTLIIILVVIVLLVLWAISLYNNLVRLRNNRENAFAYFYTSITFNPLEIADNMKKQGGFIPGIRPGKPTSDYLNSILGYIIFTFKILQLVFNLLFIPP